MNASASPLQPPVRHAPIALWRAAEAFMRSLFTLFGNPEDIAVAHTYTREPYRLTLSWLRCAEAMLRRLLLIEAAACPKPAMRPPPRPARPRTRRLMHFAPDAPHDWRVSFRCFDTPTLRQAQRDEEDAPAGADSVGLSLSKAACRVRKRFYSAWPLAERYEALIRVFNDPAPYARRLARRLNALAHRVRELFRAPPEATHRVPRWRHLDYCAVTRAAAAFNTS